MNIRELAPIIRSKNAGPYWITVDIIFDSEHIYSAVKQSGVITRELVAKLYSVSDDDVMTPIHYDQGRAIKINIRRAHLSGSPGDGDVLAMQQHAPLLEIDIPFHHLRRV